MKPDEQPAFPTMGYASGMTLRDYFAAAALQALADRDSPVRDIAFDAYLIADAMIDERNGKPEPE